MNASGISEVRDYSKRVYYTTLLQNIPMTEALKEIVNTFTNNGIDVLLLKGFALSTLLYKDTGLRSGCDIDILIHREDFYNSSLLLKRLGYTPSPTHIEVFSKGKIKIDIHRELINTLRIKSRKSILNINMDAIFRDALTVNIDGQNVKTLSMEHTLIYQSIHMLLHHGMDHPLSQSDMEMLIKIYSEKLDWQKIILTAREWKAERLLYLCLSHYKHFCNTHNSDINAILKGLHPLFIDRCLLKILTRGKPYHEMRHLIALCIVEGIMNKIKFLREVFLPDLNTATSVYQSQNLFLSYLRHFINIFRSGYASTTKYPPLPCSRTFNSDSLISLRTSSSPIKKWQKQSL